MNRRTLLTGLATLVAAPAVIRTPGLLMPVKPFATPSFLMWRAYGPEIAQYVVDQPKTFAEFLRFCAMGDSIEHRGESIGAGTVFDDVRSVYRARRPGHWPEWVWLEPGFSRLEANAAARRRLILPPRAA